MKKQKFDFLLWGSGTIIFIAYFLVIFFSEVFINFPSALGFSNSVVELINKMWWGLLLGILFVGILEKIPREFILALLGKRGTFSGILRATGAGILLDLCSHGILLVGMKLYQRGASLGQIMAFLIASPWNSFSLTLVLWGLIGFKWMLSFLLLSMAVAVISGFVFENLVMRNILPKNPNSLELPDSFSLKKEIKIYMKKVEWRPQKIWHVFTSGLLGSQMILRWILLGTVLASLVRVVLSPENFQTFFGPTLVGLGLTVFIATILEVCSEGSTPLAAELMTQARAPGNSFAFLMTGVSTDYTEIISLKETTKSWKIAFSLPLVTLPQILTIAFLLNA